MADVTLDQVKERIEEGLYVKRKVDVAEGRKTSRAWTTFRKIFDVALNEEVKNGKVGFYYCIDCKQILERDITNGTSALLSHQSSHSRKVVAGSGSTSIHSPIHLFIHSFINPINHSFHSIFSSKSRG